MWPWSCHLLVYLDDISLRIVEEYLVPLGGEGGAVIGEGDIIVTKMLFEALYVIGAEGDMASLNRVDMLAVPHRDIVIPFREMHLHAALGGEFDPAVISRILSGVRSWKILRRDRFHPQDVNVEILQTVDVLRHVVDVMKFEFHSRAPAV